MSLNTFVVLSLFWQLRDLLLNYFCDSSMCSKISSLCIIFCCYLKIESSCFGCCNVYYDIQLKLQFILLPQSAGVQFSNCPNVVVTRTEVPLPETRTEPNNESLSTRLNEAQQEVHAQPASDTRFFLPLVSDHLQPYFTFRFTHFSRFFSKFWFFWLKYDVSCATS